MAFDIGTSWNHYHWALSLTTHGGFASQQPVWAFTKHREATGWTSPKMMIFRSRNHCLNEGVLRVTCPDWWLALVFADCDLLILVMNQYQSSMQVKLLISCCNTQWFSSQGLRLFLNTVIMELTQLFRSKDHFVHSYLPWCGCCIGFISMLVPDSGLQALCAAGEWSRYPKWLMASLLNYEDHLWMYRLKVKIFWISPPILGPSTSEAMDNSHHRQC